MGMNVQNDAVDPEKTRLMIKRIIELEKRNIQTKHSDDRGIVEKIKRIIREEADAYVD